MVTITDEELIVQIGLVVTDGITRISGLFDSGHLTPSVSTVKVQRGLSRRSTLNHKITSNIWLTVIGAIHSTPNTTG